MSKQYPGGIISKTAPVPSGPYADSTAPGIWTLEQQAAYAKLGQWPTQGNINPNLFIENLFSTYLYAGSNSLQTITNNIDLSTNGGLVWTKARTTTYDHFLTDTIRGGNKQLSSNNTGASVTSSPAEITSFNTTGYTLAGGTVENVAGQDFVGWTFREQPKFFDIVTWTGTGSARTIAHNLGSTPGCIIIKCLNTTFDWIVWHRSFPANNQNAFLNTTDPAAGYSVTSSTAPTDTVFSLTTSPYTNQNGSTYVAYLFAHDAGGFGLTGTDNIVSCGSFTTDGSGLATVNLGYEPQWVMAKSSDASGNWFMFDTMRGYTADTTSGIDARLLANSSAAEQNATAYGGPNATGFTGYIAASTTYIYIAIRRGPMAVPTLGTTVFSPNVATTTIVTNTVLPSAGFPVDLMFFRKKDEAYETYWNSRLLPDSNLQANATAAEITGYPYSFASMTSVQKITNDWYTGSAIPFVFWQFRRAPSFFDQVCYTGDGVDTRMLSHNLNAQPELIISKNRQGVQNWQVIKFAPAVTTTSGTNYWIQSISTAGSLYDGTINSTFGPSYSAPSSTQYPVGIVSGSTNGVNASGITYVAYLFSTTPGVSKVGTYTGTGAAQTINCGFTSGSRFVVIKRTDSTGDWYLWDSARGIIPSNDPYVVLNSTAAPVTGTDYVDTTSVGFDITSTAPAGINANGGTYIFLAIA
jgi:hypothetical protein